MIKPIKNKVPVLNHFSHLIVNAYSYYEAALIIHKQCKKDEKAFLENSQKYKNGETFLCRTFLNKPRDHLFAIAIELLGKSIINEYEKHESPYNVPNIAEYGHDLIQIHRKIEGITEKIKYSSEGLELGTDKILNKLHIIIKWGSRYHYNGNSIKHVKKITIGNDSIINNQEANPCLMDNEIDILISLFDEYHKLHKQIQKINEF